jgi:ATP-dependent Clp protease ATP-binding subunit ClpC
MLKNSGQLPKSSAYDDDEEREEYGQMKKPTGNISQEKAKHQRLIILVEI